ncbi:MAG: PQQ-binding-like beta-propeller repeat protein [Bacteroidetes bacterium]|nr:PQQ-binding-like beta-propeller repeat protein [Bacteroidota bacterium]
MKSRFSILLSLIVSLGLLIPIQVSAQQQNSATTFRGNDQHTGVYNASGPEKFNQVKWKFKTAGKIFSSPSIANGVVYFGSNDSCLYAVDAVTGKQKWKFKTSGVVSSSPAIHDGKVFFVSFDGNLYALNAKTGSKIWSFNGGPEKLFTAPGIHGLQPKTQMMVDPWDMYLSSPVVENGVVFFGSGAGVFYAIDSKTGKKKWDFKAAGVIHSSPITCEGMVVFGDWGGKLHALDMITGKEKWLFQAGIDTVNYNQVGFQSSPAYSKGVIYTGCRDANVYAIDAMTGVLKWKYFNNYSWVICSPAVSDDVIYFGTSDTHRLIGLKATTGEVIFNTNLQAFVFASPSIAGNQLYVGDFSGSLFAINKKTGTVDWKFTTESAKENKLNVLSDKGEIRDEVFKDCNTYNAMVNVMDVLYSVGSILSSPVIEKGVVYFGSTDGYLYAIQ